MLIWLIIKSESDDESESEDIEDSGSDYSRDKVSSVSTVSSSSSDDDEEDSNKPKT